MSSQRIPKFLASIPVRFLGDCSCRQNPCQILVNTDDTDNASKKSLSCPFQHTSRIRFGYSPRVMLRGEHFRQLGNESAGKVAIKWCSFGITVPAILFSAKRKKLRKWMKDAETNKLRDSQARPIQLTKSTWNIDNPRGSGNVKQ